MNINIYAQKYMNIYLYTEKHINLSLSLYIYIDR